MQLLPCLNAFSFSGLLIRPDIPKWFIHGGICGKWELNIERFEAFPIHNVGEKLCPRVYAWWGQSLPYSITFQTFVFYKKLKRVVQWTMTWETNHGRMDTHIVKILYMTMDYVKGSVYFFLVPFSLNDSILFFWRLFSHRLSFLRPGVVKQHSTFTLHVMLH